MLNLIKLKMAVNSVVDDMDSAGVLDNFVTRPTNPLCIAFPQTLLFFIHLQVKKTLQERGNDYIGKNL